MDNRFFEQPILNSPHEHPLRHRELDDQRQPTQRIVGSRCTAQFIPLISKPRKRRGPMELQRVVLDEGAAV